jgi:hypothetical protein
LIPIEKIDVGDWVLSKPESGGELAYKRVVRTFANPPAEILRLFYYFPSDRENPYFIHTTWNHPFWVVGEGWTAAEDLGSFGVAEKLLELHDGKQVAVPGGIRVRKSDQPNVGWIGWMVDEPGGLWDFEKQREVPGPDVDAIESIYNGQDPDPFLKVPVYNLEVEDFHTYFVGEHGIWVHNTNCGGLTFATKNGTVPAELSCLLGSSRDSRLAVRPA